MFAIFSICFYTNIKENMKINIICPNCSKDQPSINQRCEACGKNLLTATTLAEMKSINEMEKSHIKKPFTPEMLVPRLGDLLIKKEIISKEELSIALEEQRKAKENGNHLLLGTAIVNLGFTTNQKLDEIVTDQIFMLQNALSVANSNLEKKVASRTAELQSALARLNELNQLKNNFVSNISHELKTPLAKMVGYIYLLEERMLGNINHEQENALKIIKKNYTRLNELISNLVEFSFASQHKLTLSSSEILLDKFMEHLKAFCTNFVNSGHLILNFTPHKQNQIFIGDFNKLSWVLEELINNAIKFSPNEEKVEVEILIKNNIITFKVIDQGIGIEEYEIAKIFEQFAQIDDSSSRLFGGIGLGLTLVKEILDLHSSSLIIQSQIGKGTKASFSLPIKE